MRIVLEFIRQLGFDPVRLYKSILNLPKYIKDLAVFLGQSKSIKLKLAPTLIDFNDAAGSARGHYFWQDLIAAQWIHKSNPSNHLDVGSRIDGFIAHLLAFRKVDVLDVRPMTAKVPGLQSTLGNAQEPLQKLHRTYQSVSSLHSIEHFGLGRYGDPIDFAGHIRGLINISETVAAGGTLIVSFPIGKPSVHFNSQRVVHPEWAVNLLTDFELTEFVLIPWSDEPIFNCNPKDVSMDKKGQCGLYKFIRKPNNV
jgi:hypothetical protein